MGKDIINNIKQNPWKYVFVSLSIILLICMTIVGVTKGSGGDDINDGYHGYSSINFYLHGDTACVSTATETNYSDPTKLPFLRYYGSGFEMIPAAIVQIFHLEKQELLVRRLIVGIFGFLLMLVTGLISKTIKDWKLASISLVVIALTPTVFGLSFNDSKDIPFALGFAISTLGMIRFIQKLPDINFSDCLLITLGIIISTSVRIGGLLLIFYFGFFFLLAFICRKDLRNLIFTNKARVFKIIGICVSLSLLGTFLGLCAYPNFFYEGPINHVKNAFLLVSKFPQNIPFIFEGKLYTSLSLPENYLIKSLFITLPFLALIGLFLFLILSFKIFKNNNKEILFFLIFTSIFPPIYIILTKASVYTGWRHILFFYSSLVTCISLGWYEFSNFFCYSKNKWIKIIPIVIFISFCFPVAKWMIKNPKYTYCYYNAFVPNPYLKYELDFFETSATEAYDWFRENELPKCKRPIILSTKIHTPIYYAAMLGDTSKVKVKLTSYMGFAETECDYSIINYQIIRPKFIKNFFPPKGTIHVEYVDGNPICAVVKRNKLDSKGIKLVREGKFAEGMQLLDSAYQFDPNNFGIWFWMGYGYYQTGKYEQSITFMDKTLAFDPNEDQLRIGNEYKGLSLHALKRYKEAIPALQNAERMSKDANEQSFIRANIGLAYYNEKDYANAIPYLQACLKQYPQLNGALQECIALKK